MQALISCINKLPIHGGSLLLILFLIIACDTGAAPTVNNQLEIRGMVLEVNARDISQIESFRLSGEDGSEYIFTTRDFIGFSPSHLVEHQVQGHSVLVKYINDNNILIALELSD